MFQFSDMLYWPLRQFGNFYQITANMNQQPKTLWMSTSTIANLWSNEPANPETTVHPKTPSHPN